MVETQASPFFEATPALRATMAVDTNTDNLAIASTNSIQFYAGSTIGDIATEPTNERMRITTTGNVGIGTTAPTTALQVGTARETRHTLDDW